VAKLANTNSRPMQYTGIRYSLLVLLRSAEAQSVWWLSYRLDDQKIVVRILTGVRNFLFSSGTPSRRFNGYCVLSPAVKQPGRGVNHSLPSSGEVESGWTSTSTPHLPSWLAQGQLYLQFTLLASLKLLGEYLRRYCPIKVSASGADSLWSHSFWNSRRRHTV
jgi:hypothetical protein